MPDIELGESIPPNTAHAVSVSLPTWRSNVGYEEGEKWVVDSMTTGYPRFFVHKAIDALADDIVAKHGAPGQQQALRAMLFPTPKTARRCLDFMRTRPEAGSAVDEVRIVDLVLDPMSPAPDAVRALKPAMSAVICPTALYPVAKQYWQHSGDGTSSRRAEFCHRLFKEDLLVPAQTSPRLPQQPQKVSRGPRRYQRASVDESLAKMAAAANGHPQNGHPSAMTDSGSADETEAFESSRFLEERYGRNLALSLVENAKSAIRRRIAGVLTTEIDLNSALPTMDSNARGLTNLREDDIYLVPCGMNAIFTTHQTLLKARGSLKSVNFGFPYVDTLKILEKFGPGAIFYGRGSEADLDEFESRLKRGEKFLGFFCEFPGNPLLTCPDLVRVRRLADAYDFAVVVDETVGTFVNINVLPFADIVVSSLTKIFSGDCNVMGGSLVLNPNGRYYDALKSVLSSDFEDNYWAEDVIFMERNSRDFRSRIDRVNENADTICQVLRAHPLVRDVYYPKYNADGKVNYDAVKTPHGGYGGLLSCTLQTTAQAVAFYDALDTAKGPSLGTNFTLTSPYVLLAHYNELDWAATFGVDPDLIRISVGLEDNLADTFAAALRAAEAV
ncbi:pyridoxal phosphate-dependent transferase [Microdochium trichocladiopsis]|uniref:cystathionine gamma-synthase n=1 Tax=Microdochium trichocladiopsis TaxID=1682393 RepID=A0A9P8Y7A6_9PEZI|nr:pyridoxal phosphate-dependent transferase [Microdochium trichocladiopsis]KAH7029362.1 pyridoxal phosphate-dependent transferase [Microdochium trichocladiopsis]